MHLLNLDVSLQDFAVMLHIYGSALHREVRRLDGGDSAASQQVELGSSYTQPFDNGVKTPAG